jgi:hypothetical protein
MFACCRCRLFLQLVSASDHTVPELRKSVTELTKKCDDLARHKRFLAHQVAESSTFGAGPANKPSNQQQQQQQQADSAAVAGDDDSGAGAAGAAEDSAGEGVECAVCRSTMSDQLQVRLLQL